MRHQAIRTTALMLCVLLIAVAPAQAGTITYSEVMRAVGASGQLRSASEVRLRFGAQSGAVQTQSTPTQGSATSSSSSDQQPQAAGTQGAGQTGSTTPASGDPTLSQSGGRVETVDLGDVTGTVCDCGEIPPLPRPDGAGFPWWPLLGGAVIPFLIPRDREPVCVVNCGPGPTPTPETPIPEPMTLLLFGSGLLALGAGARRRHGRRQVEELGANATTGEV